MCDFWPVLQRAGSHAVSKGFSHKVRLPRVPCSPCSSLTLWNFAVLSEDSWSVDSISPNDWSVPTEVKQPWDSRGCDQLRGYQPSLLFPPCRSGLYGPVRVQPSVPTHRGWWKGHGFWSQMNPDSNPNSDSCRLWDWGERSQLFQPLRLILQNRNKNGSYHLRSREEMG